MLALGPAKKVTIHVNEDTSSREDFLHREVLAFLLSRGVSGASLIRPAAGFGPHRHLHSVEADGAAGLHLPVQIQFVESDELVQELLPELLELVTDGLVEIQDTTVLKIAAIGEAF